LRFTLLELLDHAAGLDVLLREVLKKLGENGRLLGVILGIRDPLKSLFHVLLEILNIGLLQIQVLNYL
jgi:hypothetical protein